VNLRICHDGDTVARRTLGRNSSRNTSEMKEQQQQKQSSSRYKTELCRPFEEFGFCKYAEKCQFAHGSYELRKLSRHPKYKTELCKTYHTMGLCPYGHRCHFIHNREEANVQQQQRHDSSSSSTSSGSDLENSGGVKFYL